MKLIQVALLLILTFSIKAQSNEDSIWVRSHYNKQEVMIPMRDGTKLFTAIYAPKDAGAKHPILFNRTPYSCSPYGVDKFRNYYDTYLMKYLKAGYIMAYQDVRGRYMSEGDFVDIRPYNPNKKGTAFDEASDTYDAIDWLVKNTESNQLVGVFGTSYPGFYSTMAALSNHPALKAVSPQAPVTDWFIGDDFHHNGAFAFMDGFSFYSGFGMPRKAPSVNGNGANGYRFKTQDNYNFYLKLGAIKNVFKPEFMGDSVQFFKDMYAHPNYDAWWEDRNVRKYMKDIKPAMLTVGGLFDAEDCWGAWNLYKAIEKQNVKTKSNQIVMGPWIHGGWSRTDGSSLGNVKFESNTSKFYQDHIEFPFFQKHVNNTTIPEFNDIAEANIFFSGENKWKQFETWPPANIVETPFYLQPNNGLALTKPTTAKSVTTYTSDPAKPVPYTEDVHLRRTREYMTDDQRFANRRTDVISFEMPIEGNDLTVAGPVIANLMASISTTDADFVVKIIDVFPDEFSYMKDGKKLPSAIPMGGYQMLVRGEIFRGRYKTGFDKPSAFVPNKITPVKFELPDIAHTFKVGHKLMVQIQSSWFPLMDRNPQQFVNIYTCGDDAFIKSNISIWHDSKNASSIVLPVLR
jgi:uncharacterized protein